MMSSDPKASPMKRGLGRGLSALLPTAAAPSPSRIEHAPSRRTYFSAQIEEVYPGPEQPRHNFDEAELSEFFTQIEIKFDAAKMFLSMDDGEIPLDWQFDRPDRDQDCHHQSDPHHNSFP